jgi:tRNA threonylcarbamoyladenosine biosynthesis protein TsaE
MIVKNADELGELAWECGLKLGGGEVIELVGDVGVGKTTFVQGLARAIGVTGPVTSPSYTISNSYLGSDGLTLDHYDFYRLDNPGIMKTAIAESINNPQTVTVIEWGQAVAGVLPPGRRVIEIKYLPHSTEGREVIL